MCSQNISFKQFCWRYFTKMAVSFDPMNGISVDSG